MTSAPVIALPDFTQPFYFEVVVYKPGLENKQADCLSRMHEEGVLQVVVSSPNWEQATEIQQEVH